MLIETKSSKLFLFFHKDLGFQDHGCSLQLNPLDFFLPQGFMFSGSCDLIETKICKKKISHKDLGFQDHGCSLQLNPLYFFFFSQGFRFSGSWVIIATKSSKLFLFFHKVLGFQEHG